MLVCVCLCVCVCVCVNMHTHACMYLLRILNFIHGEAEHKCHSLFELILFSSCL
jgi:hypothetical protein